MFLSLPYCALDIFATEKRIKHGGECGPGNIFTISLQTIFMDLKGPLK